MARPNNGPRLKRNEAGIWCIHWTEQGRSKRVSTGTGDRAEAEQVLAGWLQEKSRPVTPADKVRAADCLREYVEAHVLPNTVNGSKRARICETLAQHFTCRVVDLDDTHVLTYIDRRRAGELGTSRAKDSTIHHELGVLTSALRHCARRKIIRASDIPHIPKPPKGEPRPFWLNEDQVEYLLAFLEREDRLQRMSREHRFIVLGLATAARRASIESLEWAHIDRTAGLIRYDLQVERQTKKRKVAVPIADWLTPYIERMERERQTDYVLDKPIDMFYRVEGAMRRVAKASGDRAYLDITPHGLRHTAATLMLRAGASLWQVAGVLGDSVETVAATYGHHSMDHLKVAANSWRKTP